MRDLERRAVDQLIQQAASWTPREAVVFLLGFDNLFEVSTGGRPSKIDRLILSSLLRRRALAEQ
jgi:hypothetical protein